MIIFNSPINFGKKQKRIELWVSAKLYRTLTFLFEMNTAINQINTIYINGRFLTQPVSGVQAFARSICKELIENKVNIKIIVPKGTKVSDTIFKPYLVFTGRQKGHLWEQFHLPGFVKKQPNSVLLNLCNSGPLLYSNQAVTIHDLAFFKNSKWFHPFFRIWYKIMVPQLVNKSKHIFTVSASIRNELLSQFSLKESKVTILTNKVSDSFLESSEQVPQNFIIPQKTFFLMVGTDDPRKNFAFVENEFAYGDYSVALVIAGGSNRNFGNTQSITSPYVHRTGFVTDSELKWLYSNAIALINPSLYEGFGIPNIEAFSMNCPVLCSDIPAFNEVCGDAAFYFSPVDTDSLKNAINEVLKNNEIVNSKTTRGKVIFTNYQNQNRSLMILKELFE